MDVKLVMFKSNGQRKDFRIGEDGVVLGRGKECSLQVPLESVSRRHCELTIVRGELRAKDLASSNGTYVNNKRVNEAELKAGDRLVVGPIIFTVQIDGVPEEIHPVKARGRLVTEGTGGAEDVVDLEADLVSQGASGGEEIDPIAALEALAAESRVEEEEEEDKKT